MPWDPVRDLQAWQERVSRHQSDSWLPPVDVYETGESYVITVEVPGLSREQIELALEENRLTIRGQRPAAALQERESVHFHQVERGHGPFARTFEFAEKIDVNGVSADLADGVLTVTLRKTVLPPPRKIEVR